MYDDATSTQRKHGSRAPLATFLLLLSCAPVALAETGLADAVTAAVQRQPEHQLADARRGVGDALQRRAGHALAGDPAVSLKYQTDAIGSDNGFREWESGVDLPLWWPGQKTTQHREGEYTVASADAMAEARWLEVAGEVRERLWQLAIAESARQEAQTAFDSATALERDVARRVTAGELPRSDLLLAQKEVLGREDALLQATSRSQQAAQRFSGYTGLAAAPAAVAEPLADARELPADHPLLMLASAESDTARAHRDRVAGERRGNPNLWIGGTRSRDAAGADYDASVGMQITVPIGSKAHAAPALAEAEAALTEAVVSQERTRLQLQEALTAATLEHRRAEATLTRSTQRQALADEALRLSRRAFELGETDLVRLLQARSDALAAHNELQAKRLELGQAVARLNQTLGVIPK